MAGLDPAIHDIADNLFLDGRLKGGHDFVQAWSLLSSGSGLSPNKGEFA